ncbi:MAG: hypothetical protein H0W50_06945 [Parachlamydiaceae bacterium]|nr:hypothetical protein [Parachlamydiaceae bacterium]
MQFIIDEGISESTAAFKSFLVWLGTRPRNFIFLSKVHPGIPDIEIIDKLLPKYQNLLTHDRVLHNRAIAEGFKSLTLDTNGNLTNKSLPGIKLKKLQPPSMRKEIEENYLQKPSDEVCLLNSRLLNSFSQKCIEKIRTKRRRIRSYFGDVANIASIDFTIASENISKAVIGGYFLKINARKSLKALMHASEGYCLDETCAHILSPIFYALSYLYCLHLTQVPVTLYITCPQALELCKTLKTIGTVQDNPVKQSVQLLLLHLTNVEFMPCVKGPFFERIQAKLDQMKHRKTNELVTVDFKAMADVFLNPNIVNSMKC